MGWAVGNRDGRDIGYGVPGQCDKPGCQARINRGMSYACGGRCGRFFCSEHLTLTEHACRHRADYKKDLNEWVIHKLRDESWARWRSEYAWEVRLLSAIIMESYRFKKVCSCGGVLSFWTNPYVEGVNPHADNCPQHDEFEQWLNTPLSTGA